MVKSTDLNPEEWRSLTLALYILLLNQDPPGALLLLEHHGFTIEDIPPWQATGQA